MRSLSEEFRHFRGQPLEIITDCGARFCGIDMDSDLDSVMLIDDEGRVIRIENRHIDAVIEPHMKLNCLCRDCDCNCDDDRRRYRDRD